MTIYAVSISQSDVVSALALATFGDTVEVPSGTGTWGSGGSFLTVPNGVTLRGQGDSSDVTLSETGGTFTNCVIRLGASAHFKNFKIRGADTFSVGAICATTGINWTVNGITYLGGTTGAYFIYAEQYGVVYGNDITGGAGTAELIFVRGPSDAWQSPSNMGDAANVFVETNTFRGEGYVCDGNANARIVVRYNLILDSIKIDVHGKATNTPARGVRQYEILRNHYTGAAGFWTALHIRGGSGVIIQNECDNSLSVAPWFVFEEASCYAQYPNFGNQYQTPFDSPIDDQIGLGEDPKSPGSQPLYVIGNTKAGANWQEQIQFGFNPIPQGAIDLYRSQTGNPSATFTLEDIIVEDVYFFRQKSSFNGSTGAGMGTASQMNAITPTKTGVGFWVTDEGNWNSAGVSGVLYVWNGSNWVYHYQPYPYPHPLIAESTLSVTTLNATTLTVG